MALQNFCNQKCHINHMNRGGYYQLQQHTGAGNYNQYDVKSSVLGLSGRKLYETNTLPPLPKRPALTPLEMKIALEWGCTSCNGMSSTPWSFWMRKTSPTHGAPDSTCWSPDGPLTEGTRQSPSVTGERRGRGGGSRRGRRGRVRSRPSRHTGNRYRMFWPLDTWGGF